MNARDELGSVLWRLRGLASFVQLIHDDEQGTPFVDDLTPTGRAAVLAVVFDLADRAEKLYDVVLQASEASS